MSEDDLRLFSQTVLVLLSFIHSFIIKLLVSYDVLLEFYFFHLNGTMNLALTSFRETQPGLHQRHFAHFCFPFAVVVSVLVTVRLMTESPIVMRWG